MLQSTYSLRSFSKHSWWMEINLPEVQSPPLPLSTSDSLEIKGLEDLQQSLPRRKEPRLLRRRALPRNLWPLPNQWRANLLLKWWWLRLMLVLQGTDLPHLKNSCPQKRRRATRHLSLSSDSRPRVQWGRTWSSFCLGTPPTKLPTIWDPVASHQLGIAPCTKRTSSNKPLRLSGRNPTSAFLWRTGWEEMAKNLSLCRLLLWKRSKNNLHSTSMKRKTWRLPSLTNRRVLMLSGVQDRLALQEVNKHLQQPSRGVLVQSSRGCSSPTALRTSTTPGAGRVLEEQLLGMSAKYSMLLI